MVKYEFFVSCKYGIATRCSPNLGCQRNSLHRTHKHSVMVVFIFYWVLTMQLNLKMTLQDLMVIELSPDYITTCNILLNAKSYRKVNKLFHSIDRQRIQRCRHIHRSRHFGRKSPQNLLEIWCRVETEAWDVGILNCTANPELYRNCAIIAYNVMSLNVEWFNSRPHTLLHKRTDWRNC